MIVFIWLKDSPNGSDASLNVRLNIANLPVLHVENRDEFDGLFDNGRIGWKDRDGKQRTLGKKSKVVREKWNSRSDKESETN